MKSIKRCFAGISNFGAAGLFAGKNGVSNRGHLTLFSIFLGFILAFSVAIPFNVCEAAPPVAPTNLTATVASSQQINLSWQDNATNETGYYVERAPSAKGKWTVIATLGANVTSYQNTGLIQETIYYYRVRCKAGNSYSSYSNTANAMTATLAAPIALTATVASVSQINLSWTDNTTYETNYYVERATASGGPYTQVGSLGANVITYSNTGLSVGTTYYYRVRAYDGTNYSAYSSVVNQTIRTIVATAGANGSITPSGTVAVANGFTKVFTMIPNAGYKIASVTVDGSAVAINPTYTFSNITANHTISATFVSSAISLTIDTPSNSATINRPDIMVKGTVTNAGGHETGVTVNGVVANVYGNEFVANHVPLLEDANVITVSAIDINGETSTASVTVNAVTTGNYIRLNADTEAGVAPLVTTLRIDGSFSISASTLNATGPVQPDFLFSSADKYQVQMTSAGIYYFTASATGPDGNPYQDTIGINAMALTAMDNLLKGKWTFMIDALNQGNVPSALTKIAPNNQARYQTMFTVLGNQLPSILATANAFNLISITDSVAKYKLLTTENSKTYSYEVIFIKDVDGLWKIKEF